jgi:hypothetical protein
MKNETKLYECEGCKKGTAVDQADVFVSIMKKEFVGEQIISVRFNMEDAKKEIERWFEEYEGYKWVQFNRYEPTSMVVRYKNSDNIAFGIDDEKPFGIIYCLVAH